MASVPLCKDTFVFEGVTPAYVKSRFINIDVDFTNNSLVVTEYEELPSTSDDDVEHFTFSQHLTTKEVHRLTLPDGLNVKRVIGRITCIGCVDSLLVCQYITTDKEYVRFMTLNTATKEVGLFEDTHHFFHRDSAVVQPVGCLLSPDKAVCLLRLPQTILAPNKWSKVIECKKSDKSTSLSQTNPIMGTSPSKFRDRKFQLMAFHPSYPNRLATLLIDSYCSKCNILVYDIEIGKEVYQTSRKLPTAAVFEERMYPDYDSDEEDLTYFFLKHCSMEFTRSGDTLVVYCGVVDNRSNAFCNVYFFNSKTYELVGYKSFRNNFLPFEKDGYLLPVLSGCDSQVSFWDILKNRNEFIKLFYCSIPKPINLKSICRAVIIAQTCSSRHLHRLPLPTALLQYLEFKYKE